ncbi:putative RNA polymerase sigma factor [Devosia sp. UYZn731]
MRNRAGEAIWLGLLALVLYSHARLAARRDAAGEFVSLAD